MKKAHSIGPFSLVLLIGMKKGWLLGICFMLGNTLLAQEARLWFKPNLGQWSNNPSKAQLPLPSATVFFHESEFRLLLQHPEDAAQVHESFHQRSEGLSRTLRQHGLFVEFEGANSQAYLEFKDPAPWVENYFLGADSRSWKTGIHPYSVLYMRDVYPNISLRFYESKGQLEFDFILEPGADVRDIRMKIEGSSPYIDEQGKLQLPTSCGLLSWTAPLAFSSADSSSIDCAFKALGDGRVGIETSKREAKKGMVIDPILVFSTYSGSTGDNFGFTATYDTAECLYAGGIVDANGATYPVTAGAFQTTYGGSSNGGPPVQLPCDISISKYSKDGSTLLWASYLGGDDDEYPHSLVVDPSNNLLILGTTLSTNFPVASNAYDATHNGSYDIVISKLSADGSTLMAGTFLGGSSYDGFQRDDGATKSQLLFNYADNYRGDILADSANVYLATCTRSTNFPTTAGAYQSTAAGLTDAAIVCLNKDLSQLNWATRLGGNNDDAAYSVKLDGAGHLFIGGGTASSDFPMTGNGIWPNYHNPSGSSTQEKVDGYISRFDAKTGAYQVGTFFGGAAYDQIYFLDIDLAGKVYFTGQTKSRNFTLTNGVYGKSNTGQFIGRLSNDLSQEEFFTTFGNRVNVNPELSPSAFMVDDCFNIYFSGWGSIIGVGNSGTTSGLPTTPNANQITTDGNDFYLIVLGKDAQNLLYASYFGGSQSEDHVDGGTSRFDKKGVIYQSVCASCPNSPPGLNDFPTSSGSAFPNNVSIRCSNASFKLDFRLTYSIDALFSAQPQPACQGEDIRFTPNTVYQAQYFWDFGDGTLSRDTIATHRFADTGRYWVQLSVVDSNSCNRNANHGMWVYVGLKPSGKITATLEPCIDFTELLLEGQHFDTLIWDFGDGSPQIRNTNPLNHNYISGSYTVTAYLLNGTTLCRDTVELPLIVNTDSSGEIYLANVFTPGRGTIDGRGDGKNDCFRVYGLSTECDEAELRIFNRWGERIFYTEDLSICWNGKVQNGGPELPDGTYFYQLYIKTRDQQEVNRLIAGSVNLIREP